MLMLVIASIFVFVWLYVFNKKKLNAKWWEILIITIIHVCYGVLTVKFFAILEVGFDLEKAGNISLFGGIFFMPLMYFVYAKIKKLPLPLVFDIFVISLAGTLLLARINCLYAGCCQGIELGSSGFRWPAREVDLAIHGLFLVLAIPWICRDKSRGLAYPLYMVVYGLFRFINEWFRVSDSTSPLHIGHVWAILSLIIGSTFLIIINKKCKEGGKNCENE